MQSENETAHNLARQFFMEEWGDEKIRLHSECVIEACLNMTAGTGLNKDIFTIAGWIHDLGRKTDKDRHHELSVDIFWKFLKKHPEYNNIEEEVRDCIIHHRKDGKPKTTYGLVFKAADKVALHNKKWLEYKKKKGK